MKILEQFVRALYNNTVRNKATEMFRSNFSYNGHKDRMPLELLDITYRLFKPTPDYVNFEFLAKSNYGSYFQPIGMIDRDLNIYVINEFAEEYKKLNSSSQISGTTKFLDKKSNAVIACFSADTLSRVFEVFKEFDKYGSETQRIHGFVKYPGKRYDRYYECNGFACELIFSNNGYPQFYLDSDYGIEGPIGAYIKAQDGNISIHPTPQYQELTNKLNLLQLLTAFTRF
jgi:hypothetical protein